MPQGSMNGIMLEGGEANQVTALVNEFTGVGIHLKNTQSNVLDGTVTTTEGTGILLENGTNNVLGVVVESAAIGVELNGSRGNQLTGSMAFLWMSKPTRTWSMVPTCLAMHNTAFFCRVPG